MEGELDRALLRHLQGVFLPLSEVEDDEDLAYLLDALGWDPAALGITGPGGLAPAIAQLVEAIEGLEEPLAGEQLSLAELGEALLPLAAAAARLSASIAGLLPSGDALAAALPELAKDLFGFLLEQHLSGALPLLSIPLQVVGFIRWEDAPPIEAGGKVVRRAIRRRRLDGEALLRALQDPLGYFTSLADRERARFAGDPQQQLRTAEAVADLVGPELADGLVRAGLSARYGSAPEEIEAALGPEGRAAVRHLLLVDFTVPTETPEVRTRLRIALGPEASPEGDLGFVLATQGTLAVTLTLPRARLTAAVAAQPAPLLFSSKGVTFASGGPGIPQVEAQVEFQTDPARAPAARFGSAGGTHFQVGSMGAKMAVDVDPAGVELDCAVDAKGALLAVKGGDGDGFLKKVLGDGFEVPFDLAVGFSTRRGLYFSGGAGLDLRIPVDKALGPIRIADVHLELLADAKGLRLHAATTGSLELGPFKATVKDVGVQVRLEPGKPGVLGNADLALGFKPPNGISLRIKSDAVTGGGYLEIDVDKQQYAGIVQLAIKNSLNLTAIGLINARLPDGRPGFSLLLVITAQFPPIQLGMGFTLNGVGGLAGVNRTSAVDVLRTGLRTGALDTLLFPPDPLGDPPGLIRTVGAIFPVAEGRYVFGPMVRIGWGSPTLLTLDLCVLLELPDPVRVIILGRLAVSLPDPKNPVVKLRMDALGVIDFGRSEFSLDATLYDSKILTFTLTGDMAMRLRWGKEPDFILSVGGFNPRYPAPPALPPLRRMALSLVDKKEIRVRLESYLALTSNTAQFGARVEFLLQALGVEAAGWLGFDALFHFAPFELVADLAAAVAVSWNGQQLLAADLLLTLTGPTPWHLIGHARLVILGVPAQVPVELLIGDPAPPELPPPVDVLELVRGALGDPRNWAPRLPAGAEAVATLRPLEDPPPAPGGPLPPPLLHPLAAVEVRQTVAPLGVDLQRFGSAPVLGDARFELAALPDASGRAPAEADLREQFAMGQFLVLTDDEKLERPAFEPARAGLRLGGEAFAFAEAGALSSILTCEMHVIEPGVPSRKDGRHVIAPTTVAAMTAFAAAAERRTAGAARYREAS